jgi:hypothetical protein
MRGKNEYFCFIQMKRVGWNNKHALFLLMNILVTERANEERGNFYTDVVFF